MNRTPGSVQSYREAVITILCVLLGGVLLIALIVPHNTPLFVEYGDKATTTKVSLEADKPVDLGGGEIAVHISLKAIEGFVWSEEFDTFALVCGGDAYLPSKPEAGTPSEDTVDNLGNVLPSWRKLSYPKSVYDGTLVYKIPSEKVKDIDNFQVRLIDYSMPKPGFLESSIVFSTPKITKSQFVPIYEPNVGFNDETSSETHERDRENMERGVVVLHDATE